MIVPTFIASLLLLFSTSLVPLIISEKFIKRYMKYLFSISSGLLISFLFIELLPHSFGVHSHCHSHTVKDTDTCSNKNKNLNSFSELYLLIGFCISLAIDFVFEYTNTCPHNHCHDLSDSSSCSFPRPPSRCERSKSKHTIPPQNLSAPASPQTPTIPPTQNSNSKSDSDSRRGYRCFNLVLAKFIHSLSDGVILLPPYREKKCFSMVILTGCLLLHEVPMNLASYTVYLKSGKNALLYNCLGNSSYFIVFLFSFFTFYNNNSSGSEEGGGVMVPFCTGFMVNMVLVGMMKDCKEEIEKGCKKTKGGVFGALVGGVVFMSGVLYAMRKVNEGV